MRFLVDDAHIDPLAPVQRGRAAQLGATPETETQVAAPVTALYLAAASLSDMMVLSKKPGDAYHGALDATLEVWATS